MIDIFFIVIGWIVALYMLITWYCIEIDHEQRLHYIDLTHSENTRDIVAAVACGTSGDAWRRCDMRWDAYDKWCTAVFGDPQ